jgi:phage-related protein
MTLRKRPAIFLGDTKKRLRRMPEPVRKDIGVALDIAQHGQKPNAAKPLQGFGGAGVLEIVDDYDGNTYRAVYTVRLVHAVYVLHAFQKKSKSGAKLPGQDADLIRERLKTAEMLDRSMQERMASKDAADG